MWTLMGADSELWPPRCFSQNLSLVHRSPGFFPLFQEKLPPKWENAVYLLDDICYYFVRQHDETPYGFLTAYDLRTGTWAEPVLIGDSQSRGDFILFDGELYLFHAPIDREHIGIVRINTENLAKSEIIVQAKMHSSCFYPFVQYYDESSLAMSYTVARQHIRLARFSMEAYTK